MKIKIIFFVVLTYKNYVCAHIVCYEFLKKKDVIYHERNFDKTT